MTAVCVGSGRAAGYLARCNLGIIAAAAARRQGYRKRADGARSPAALGQGGVRLDVITRPLPGGRADAVTPLGYKTARRVMPQLLAGLDPSDPRRQVADMLATACERIGAVGGVDWQGGDTKGGQSDGGATTRVKHAERLRLFVALANGWRVDRRGRVVQRGPVRVILPVIRRTGNRQEIQAYPALVALCVDGADMASILSAHGWPKHGKHSRRLGRALLAVLDEMAVALGHAPAGKSEMS